MKSPASILFDISGIPTAVSASSQPLSGALGQVMAGFDATNSVRYAKFDGNFLQVTGSVGITGTTANTPVYVTGSIGINGTGGVATEATLSSINTKTPSLGQATMANSVPVVIASNQSVVTASLDNGVVSTSNSSTSPLGGAATFTGTWEEVTNYASISLIVNTDQNGTLYIDSSTNGSDVDRTIQLSSGTTNPSNIHTVIPISRYTRVRLVNGAVAQSYLRLQTILNKTGRVALPVSRNASTLSDYTDVLNTRSAIVGKYNATPPTLTDGDRADIQLDSNGRLVTSVVPAVKEVSTAALSAGATYTTATFDTINGQNVINISVFSTTDMDIFFDESNDGSNWAVINTASIQANLGKNETHVIAARYCRVRYKNGTTANAGGISNLFLASSLTTFGNDTNVNIADEFGNVVGADRLTGLRVKPPGDTAIFGAAISHSRISQLTANFSNPLANNSVTTSTTGTGTAAVSNASLLLTTGTGTTSTSTAVTNAVLSYTPGREAYAMFTAAFTTPTSANSAQRIGLFDANNGFFIGYVGTTFRIGVRQNGVDTTVSQSSFDGDTLSGNTNSRFTRNFVPEAIDLTKKNVFRIRFGWLGSAPIKFEVLSPDGEWVPFHTVNQPNTAADPSIFSTALPIRAEATKTAADATSLVLNTSSWDAGVVSIPGEDNSTLGSITAANGTTVVTTTAKSMVTANITGTWTGTLVFEGHNGDNNWAALSAYTTAFSIVTSTTTNQLLEIVCTGLQQVRIRASAWTSGTATVSLRSSGAPIEMQKVFGDVGILKQDATSRELLVSGSTFLTRGTDGTTHRNLLTDTLGKLQVSIASGSAGIVSVLTGSQVASLSDRALVVHISPNQQPIPTSVVPSTSIAGSAIGRVTGVSANTFTAVRATTYVEQTTGAQRSIVSTSANDSSAGTGARQVTITYLTATGAGPFTETLTLNGLTAVNTTATDICFIERMDVISVGSNGSNVGTLNLYTGTGATGTIFAAIGTGAVATGVGDNQTFYAHHYVPTGYEITGYYVSAGIIASAGGGSSVNVIRYRNPTVATSPWKLASDFVNAAQGNSAARVYYVSITIPGPAVILGYATPGTNNSTATISFDYADAPTTI